MSVHTTITRKNISNDDFGDQVQRVIKENGIDDVGEIRFSNSGYYSVLGTSALTGDRTVVLPNTSGTIALTSDIPSTANFVTLSGSQTISGVKTFSAPPAISSISNTGTLTLPTSSGTIALTSDIPSLSNFATLNDSQTMQNKSLSISSNTSIASFTASVITSSFPHNLGIGDVIRFLSVGNMIGISAATNYTVSAVPTTTSFSLTGITTLSGSVGAAVYYLSSRDPVNVSTVGGSLKIYDASNANNPIIFDTAGATQPIIIQCPITTAARFSLPSFGGTVAVLANSQTFSGAKTFSGGIISTKAGSTTAAGSGIYSNPPTVAMTAANSYFYNYFGTPLSTGSTSGTSSNLCIQGTTTTAANNYSLQILAGQSSLPSATVANPAIVFGNSNSSGFYSSAANTVNTAISGVNVHQVSSTGLNVTGIIQASTSIVTPICRPISGNQITSCPAVNLSTGTADLMITPSSSGWTSTGTSRLLFGDTSHRIQAENAYGMTIVDVNQIIFSSGNNYSFLDNGSTTYLSYGSVSSDPIASNAYGLNFGSGSASGSLNLFANSASGNVKIARSTDGDCIRFYRNQPGVTLVGAITVSTTGTTYFTTSDRKLKKDIVAKSDSLSKIKQMKVYDYKFRSDDKNQKCSGVLADELRLLLPEAVFGEDGKKDEYGNIEPMMVDYSRIVPYLIGAIQQLSEAIEDLHPKT